MTNLTNQLAYNLTSSGITTTGDIDSVEKLESIISTIFGILTIVAAIYFVIQIIFAGFSLISSKGDPKLFQAAQNKIIYDILGLLIVVVAFGLTAFLTNLLGLSNIFSLTNSLSTVK